MNAVLDLTVCQNSAQLDAVMFTDEPQEHEVVWMLPWQLDWYRHLLLDLTERTTLEAFKSAWLESHFACSPILVIKEGQRA